MPEPILIPEPPFSLGSGDPFKQNYGIIKTFLKPKLDDKAFAYGVLIDRQSACTPAIGAPYAADICLSPNPDKGPHNPVLTLGSTFLPRWNLLRGKCSAFPLDLNIEERVRDWVYSQLELVIQVQDLDPILSAAPLLATFSSAAAALAAAEQAIAATNAFARGQIFLPVRAASLLFSTGFSLIEDPDTHLLVTRLGNPVVILRDEPNLANRVYFATENRSALYIGDPIVLDVETARDATSIRNDRLVTVEVPSIFVNIACEYGSYAYNECCP